MVDLEVTTAKADCAVSLFTQPSVPSFVEIVELAVVVPDCSIVVDGAPAFERAVLLSSIVMPILPFSRHNHGRLCSIELGLQHIPTHRLLLFHMFRLCTGQRAIPCPLSQSFPRLHF